LLSSGGNASGPVSFMRGADASAGTIKSGGATRRAAKMVILDVDHPDIEGFIETKVKEEEKIRALRDAGFDMDLGGDDITSVQYQNANNSVRVNDTFMKPVETGGKFGLTSRMTGEVIEEVDAKSLFRKMAEAAWACADPGIQYDDTINHWHTCPESGRINGSNPCSEYTQLDNTSCNLASLNLMKFLKDDSKGNQSFEVERFAKVVELVITAMDISICFADFPTQKIGENTRAFRQLGIGYANLGALLMATGHAYDSDGGRALAGSITSLMTGTSYRRSAELAAVVGPYDGYARNAQPHLRVMKQHSDENTKAVRMDDLDTPIWAAATEAWQDVLRLGEKNGFRNAQASVIAPTGTIGLAMSCDTTGLEPDLALVKFKKLVGGGSMQIVNGTVPQALRRLGYQEEQIEAIVAHIAENGNVIDAPGLKHEHYEVFDCAMGERSISAMGHVRMMAAIQPWISGALSKTVNLPETATVEDVEEVYFEAWKMGVKALAIYRDNCKVGQPLSAKTKEKEKAEVTEKAEETIRAAVEKVIEYRPVRKRLPKGRPGITTSFTVGGAEVPLETYVSKFTNMRFEPAGMTDDPDVRMAQSIVDYIFRRLALDFLPFETRSALGIHSAEERQRHLETGSYEPTEEEVDVEGLAQSAPRAQELKAVVTPKAEVEAAKPAPQQAHTSAELVEMQLGIQADAELVEMQLGIQADAPLCFSCGTKMQRAGSCYICEGCGSTSGCS
ncbi:MAG: vitamin B12-dependent ribonucleotide reductase, partial [Streptomyces sp.]|nr:vitamin B12-dependent ribonucleotide reductase [Streptomyces sp.]